ncbi:MAG: MFS transporter [Armatimonadetes bacterium]|nr:MFS transporter [Armatimonadota bacterium]MDE2205122.1 MFS transporter [Armatimonadota bacterium]
MSAKALPRTADDKGIPPLGLWRALVYSVANLGYGAFFSFNNAVLPLYLKQFTHNNVLLGLAGSTHSIEGTVLQPVVGAVSDGSRSALGRRRPFMVLFTPICALFLIVTPLCAHLAPHLRLAAMVACIVAFTATFNFAYDPYVALMPDITPEVQRGRVEAVWALFGNAGQAGILLLPALLAGAAFARPAGLFAVTAALMLGTAVFTICCIGERPNRFAQRRKVAQPGARIRAAANRTLFALRGLATLRQAAISILALCVAGAGISAVLPFLTLFVTRIGHTTDAVAEGMFLVLMAATAAAVLPAGWLTDRLGSRRMLLAGLTLIAAACLGGLVVHTVAQIRLVMVLAGIGNAAQAASAYPLLTELIPAEEMGLYTGLQTSALSIMQPAAVAITGWLIGRGGYRVVFAVCAVGVLAGAGVLLLLREKRAIGEIARRKAELAAQ